MYLLQKRWGLGEVESNQPTMEGENEQQNSNILDSDVTVPSQPLAEYASINTAQEDVQTSASSGRDAARGRWITVEVIVALVAASYGGIASVNGQYIRYRVSRDLAGNETMNSSLCQVGNASDLQNEIQSVTAQWNLKLTMAGAIPSMIATFVFGTLSDRFGRRLPILFPIIGMFLQCSIAIMIVSFDLNLAFFFLANIASSSLGSLSLFMAGCFSYATDITEEKARMIRIVVIEILIFVGIGLMEIGIGYAIREIGFMWALLIPFVALSVSLVNAATPCLLIETIRKEKGGSKRKIKDIMHDTIQLFKETKDNRRFSLVMMLASGLATSIVVNGAVAIVALYGQGPPFCWESVTIGFYTTVALIIPGIGTVVGAGLFSYCKVGYLWIVQVSVLSGMCNILVLAMTFLFQSTALIFASNFFGLFKFLGMPVIRTFLSTLVGKHEHGALFASLGVLDTIALVIAPLLVNGIYSATVKILSTLVFFVMAGLLIIPLTLTGILQCKGVGKQASPSLSRDLTPGDNDECEPLVAD